MTSYRNPIIPGFNPDPSVCRVGEDYYLVTSSFEYFPGVPVYHSKNLVNWELIGHCLTRDSQLRLLGCRCSGGIYAPTIRYHEGVFYMITTNVTDRGNFIVHTTDPAGEWSEPAVVHVPGIDPSLFWDEDGACWFCGKANGAIRAAKVDPMTGELLSEVTWISDGVGGQCVEAPHIYKKDGWYYLCVAEGGTEYGHRVTFQRSRDILGPYEPCPHNPVISHREAKGNPIQGTGHADIFEDQHGRWWAVLLAFRNYSNVYHSNLGRETFLCPVEWVDGWPVFNGGNGIALEMEAELPAEVFPVDHSFRADFTQAPISPRLVFTRNPVRADYELDTSRGALILHGSRIRLTEAGASPTELSVRQASFCTEVTAEIDLDSITADRCGIAAYHMNNYHYDLYILRRSGRLRLGFSKSVHDMTCEQVDMPFDKTGKARLFITTDKTCYRFGFYTESGDKVVIGEGINAGLAQETTCPRSFTGTFFSMFAEFGDVAFTGFEMRVVEP